MRRISMIALSVAAVAMAGCAETPKGPMVQVLPGQGKPFEKFQEDQILCKSYANDQVAGQAENANTRAVAGTLIGAALGAALGGAVDGGHGAGVGAAVGGVGGTAVGAGSSSGRGHGIQAQYDNAYSQCMYAKGNQIVANPATVHVVHSAPVYYAAPPIVYQTAPTIYAQPAPAGGYSAPTGAAIPPANQPPPKQ